MYTSFARKLGILGFLCGLLLSSIAWQGHAASNEQNVYLPVVILPPPVHVERTIQAGSRGGGTYVEGEIVNDVGRPLYNVTIEAMFREQSNPEHITTTTTVTAFPATLSDQRNAFRSQVIFGSIGQWAFEKAYPTSWQLMNARDYRAVTIVRAEPCADTAQMLCVELRNDYPRTLQSITILLGYQGEPHLYDWYVHPEALAPQATRMLRFQRPYEWNFAGDDWAAKTWIEAQAELVP